MKHLCLFGSIIGVALLAAAATFGGCVASIVICVFVGSICANEVLERHRHK